MKAAARLGTGCDSGCVAMLMVVVRFHSCAQRGQSAQRWSLGSFMTLIHHHQSNTSHFAARHGSCSTVVLIALSSCSFDRFHEQSTDECHLAVQPPPVSPHQCSIELHQQVCLNTGCERSPSPQ